MFCIDNINENSNWHINTDIIPAKYKNVSGYYSGLFYDEKIDNTAFFEALSSCVEFDFNKWLGEYIGFELKDDVLDMIVTPTGTQNVYMYNEGNNFIISSDIAQILSCMKNHNIKVDLDYDTILGFFIFGFTIGENTYVRNIKRFKFGHKIHIDRFSVKYTKIFDVNLDESNKADYDVLIDEMDMLFDSATKKYIDYYGKNARYCLGLSNGMDSRLTAYYMKKYTDNIFAYFFGEFESREGISAKAVADVLNIPLYTSDEYNTFPDLFDEQTRLFPISTVEWAKYGVARKDIPDFDVLLSGYIGNHLFGGWEYSFSNKEVSDNELASELVEKFRRIELDEDTRNLFVEKFSEILHENNNNTLSKKSEFWFRSIIQHEKESYLFNDENKPHQSIFSNLHIVKAAFKLPHKYYRFRKLYIDLLEKKCNCINVKTIPSIQVINSHKPIENWLKNNDYLYEYLAVNKENLEYISREMCHWNMDVMKTRMDIYNGIAKRNEIHQLFRVLTIARFIEKFVEDKYERI